MKHIVSFSGGKDSTAMLLMMINKGLQIDEIVFCDTSAEFEAMYKHIDMIEKAIDRPVTRLHFEHDFMYYMLDYEKKKGKSKGSHGYGWCGGMCRWGTTLKQQLFDRYIKKKYDNKIIEYQGIAVDEPERLKRNSYKKWAVKYPLAEWNVAEAEALKYCYELGYDYENLYNILDHVSCRYCRNKNLKELRNIYYELPDLYNELVNLEIEIGEEYRKGKTLKDFEWYGQQRMF